MATATKQKVETMVVEWCNQRDSGYRPDGGNNSPLDSKVTCGSQCFIPNTGKMAREILNDKGEGTGKFEYVAIRYVKGCQEIEVELQKKMGVNPSRITTEDQIMLPKGNGLFKNEGDLALYKYVANVFWNEDAPNRSKNVKSLYRIVKKEQKVTSGNELEFAKAEAVIYVKKLVTKTGNEYKYNEAKIDSCINILSLPNLGSYSDKISVLTQKANQKPIEFLQTVTKLDDTLTTEISYALQLDLIRFAGNVAEYCDDKKILASLGEGQMKQAAKITKLADLLNMDEYKGAYEEFKIKLELAQEKSITQ